MRLRRLNLIRYGHFTDFSLDFGPSPTNGPDFHIIYGDNEAGKSTALNGYLDFLFGFTKQSKYAFLHEYKNLCMGATLEINNRVHELKRIKRQGMNLVDANGQPVDAEILTKALHRLPRESYQTMFSLNDETLERGGEEILASRGELGRLLFEGSAGMANLTDKLELLRECANNVYAERSRTHEIASLRQELEQLDKERRNLEVRVNVYENLVEMHRKAEDAYRVARKDQDNIRNEFSNLKILETAFPIWENLMGLEKELEIVKHLPDVPTDWIIEVKKLQQRLDIAEEKKDEAEINIDSTEKILENLSTDPLMIKVQEEDFRTLEILADRNQTAKKELSKCHDDLFGFKTKIDEIRQRLGADETVNMADFVIPDFTITELEGLSQQKILLDQSLKTAQQEVFSAEEALQQAQNREKNVPPPDEKVDELIILSDGCVEVLQRLEQAEKRLSEKRLIIEKEFKKLTPWSGNRNHVKSLALPTSGQIAPQREKISKLEKELDKQRLRQAEYKEHRASHFSRVETLSGQLGAISDTHAAHSRKVRNDAWTTHRSTLDDKTAEEFETALASDDHICERRLAAADRLANLRIEEVKLAETERVYEIITEEINRIDRELQVSRNEMLSVFAKVGLPVDFQVENLSEWLDKFHYVRELIGEEDECCFERDLAKYDYDQRQSILLAALTKIGEKPLTCDLKELCARAKIYQTNVVKDEERRITAKSVVLQAEAQMRSRKKNLEIAEDKLREWQINWKNALEGRCWLEQKNIDQIGALLNPLRKLEDLLLNQKKLSKIITEKRVITIIFAKVYIS